MLTTLALSIPREVYAIAWLVLIYAALWWLVLALGLFDEAPVVARACGWCGDFPTARDEALASEGVPVTTFWCPSCEARAYREAGVEVGSDG